MDLDHEGLAIGATTEPAATVNTTVNDRRRRDYDSEERRGRRRSRSRSDSAAVSGRKGEKGNAPISAVLHLTASHRASANRR